MHEMTLLEEVVGIVLNAVEGKPVKRVTAVHLRIGEHMDVIDELVPGLFEFLVRGTVAEGAEVVIEHVPAYVQCVGCYEAWHIDVYDEKTWTCPRCGARRHYRSVSGREFSVESIEVEVEEETEDRLAG